MVATAPNECLAFIADASPGATGCAQAAQAAGIPTTRHTSASATLDGATATLDGTTGSCAPHDTSQNVATGSEPSPGTTNEMPTHLDNRADTTSAMTTSTTGASATGDPTSAQDLDLTGTPTGQDERLVAVVNGPMAGQWFTLTDWRARRAGAADLQERAGIHQPCLDYLPGTQLVAHPHREGVSGIPAHYAPARHDVREAQVHDQAPAAAAAAAADLHPYHHHHVLGDEPDVDVA
jgi:hypothetical protein